MHVPLLLPKLSLGVRNELQSLPGFDLISIGVEFRIRFQFLDSKELHRCCVANRVDLGLE